MAKDIAKEIVETDENDIAKQVADRLNPKTFHRRRIPTISPPSFATSAKSPSTPVLPVVLLVSSCNRFSLKLVSSLALNCDYSLQM
ncbi:hypothetical protein V2J09_010871 [Rumex salicifolius]